MIYRLLAAVRTYPTGAITVLAPALLFGSIAHFMLTATAFIRLAGTAETRRSEIRASLQTARSAAADIDNAKLMFSLAVAADIFLGASGVGFGLWGTWRTLKGRR